MTIPPVSCLTDLVGRTPLIRLKSLSQATGCELWAKVESCNPGGSIKDRAALAMIAAGEGSGALRPGGTLIEATAGNTGIGLALYGRLRGYRTLLVVPADLASEKVALLRALGAEIVTAPAEPFAACQELARSLAARTPGGWWVNQFDNLANQECHYRATGPELWAQTEGRLTGFVSTVGSGGTLAGVSRFLKEQRPSLRVVAADPEGAAMYHYFKYGRLTCSPGDSVAEGIGQTRLTANLQLARVDDAVRIPDALALNVLHSLLREEGLFVGLSAAVNVAAMAVEALRGGPGQTLATLLCDSGSRYLSKYFSPSWLEAHGFQVHADTPTLLEALRALATNEGLLPSGKA